MLHCPICSSYKSLEEFHNCNGATFNRAYYCKACANARSILFHQKHKHSSQYVTLRRESYIKMKYGLSLAQYIEKLKAQNFLCAICQVELQTSGSGTHLDHDHKTGQLRAFLCTNCNRAIGHFHDDVKVLQSAIDYLKTHSQRAESEERTENL